MRFTFAVGQQYSEAFQWSNHAEGRFTVVSVSGTFSPQLLLHTAETLASMANDSNYVAVTASGDLPGATGDGKAVTMGAGQVYTIGLDVAVGAGESIVIDFTPVGVGNGWPRPLNVTPS